jgi:hypothetical protein
MLSIIFSANNLFAQTENNEGTITSNGSDQENKTVTLVVSGQGKTQDEAKQNALRSAIEQAFGTFISSKTELVNDNLVKDEIISVSNGNIQKYELISKILLSNGSCNVTLKTTVSISKLTSFCENKGISIEFKGSLFAMNIKHQKLNEDAEIKAVTNMVSTLKSISDKSFDYSIESIGEPKVQNGNPELWNIPFFIYVKPNANLEKYRNYFQTTLEGLSMNDSEVENYVNLNKPFYSIYLRSVKEFKDTIVQVKNLESYLIGQFNIYGDTSNSIHDKEIIIDNLGNIKNITFYELIKNGFKEKNRIKYIHDIYNEYLKSAVNEVKVTVKNKDNENNNYYKFYLRNDESVWLIQELILYFKNSLQNFIVNDGNTSRTFNMLSTSSRDSDFEGHGLIIASTDAFQPALLGIINNQYDCLSILNANQKIYCGVHELKEDFLESIKYGQSNRNRPIDYKLEKPYKSKRPELKLNKDENCYFFNCNYSNYNVWKYNRKLEYAFPGIANQFIGYEKEQLINKSAFNTFIQLNNLTDEFGISAIYYFQDQKKIDELEKISEYKIMTIK